MNVAGAIGRPVGNDLATHVDADAEVPRDRGSIPRASTQTACDQGRKPFLFAGLYYFDEPRCAHSGPAMSEFVSEIPTVCLILG